MLHIFLCLLSFHSEMHEGWWKGSSLYLPRPCQSYWITNLEVGSKIAATDNSNAKNLTAEDFVVVEIRVDYDTVFVVDNCFDNSVDSL